MNNDDQNQFSLSLYTPKFDWIEPVHTGSDLPSQISQSESELEVSKNFSQSGASKEAKEPIREFARSFRKYQPIREASRKGIEPIRVLCK